MDGILSVLKPSGMSSHDVVGYIRRISGIKKVGHAGTLDPHAVGVLPVLIGRATKLSEYLMEHDKIYRVHIYFGLSTTTGDSEGEEVQRDNVDISLGELQEIVPHFIGEIEQRPPSFSAIKVNGKKLYELARAGKEVEIPVRKIKIYNLYNIKELGKNSFSFDVKCSKGTYIRSLCVDIGKKLGVPAFMSALIRMEVGSFNIENSFTLEEIAQELEQKLIPVDRIISFKETIVSDKALRYIMNGCSSSINFLIGFEYSGEENIKVYTEENEFIGIARIFDEDERKVFKINTFFAHFSSGKSGSGNLE